MKMQINALEPDLVPFIIFRAKDQPVPRAQLFGIAFSIAFFDTFSARFSALSGDSINFTTVKAGIHRSFPVCWQIRPVSRSRTVRILFTERKFHPILLISWPKLD